MVRKPVLPLSPTSALTSRRREAFPIEETLAASSEPESLSSSSDIERPSTIWRPLGCSNQQSARVHFLENLQVLSRMRSPPLGLSDLAAPVVSVVRLQRRAGPLALSAEARLLTLLRRLAEGRPEGEMEVRHSSSWSSSIRLILLPRCQLHGVHSRQSALRASWPGIMRTLVA